MGDQPDGQNLGRRPVLDESKRRTVIAMLANGSSRRVAAGYVGCAPSTITRTAARDPEFAAQLDRAQCNAETEALSLIRKAAHKERYWRAAAWILERRNPADFAPQKPNALTEQKLREILGSLAILVKKDLPEEKLEQFLARLDEILLIDPNDPPEPDPLSLALLEAELEGAPSAGRDFATDPTTETEKFGENESSQTFENMELTSTQNDATLNPQ
jgi:hypothetical protein